MNDPIVAGALIGIALAIYFTVHFLKVQQHQEWKTYHETELQESRAAYLNRVHLKYAGDQPHGYRRANHLDFAGEQPISSARLEEIKREISN